MKKASGPSILLVVGAIAMCAPSTALSQHADTRMTSPTTSALELRQGMRELWADHVIWTRQYIVAAVANDPSASAALSRLMKNQEDIGDAIAPFYGAAADAALTDLLKEHIRIAGEVVAAAKAGDDRRLADADRRWHENAAEIATFLSGANPHWSKDDLQMMLDEHLALTTREAVARLRGDWDEDVVTFDRIFDQALSMADALSEGILRQFHGRM